MHPRPWQQINALLIENRIFDQASYVQILIWVHFRGLQSVAVNLRYSDLKSIGYFDVKSADEGEHDFYEIGRQANFQGFFNEKPQKIAYLKKIFALPLGLLGLATDNDS